MEPTVEPRKRRYLWLWALGSFLGFCILFRVFCGFYTIQPIGAAPKGSTVIVWRETGEPFFNSPDALCLERVGSVSLLCRGMAISQAPVDRIIIRLPYWAWAYRQSTGGREFSR
jgi:hypothetical protein